MKTLTVDTNNDLTLGPDGNLAFSTGLKAVGEVSVQFARARRGEMVHAMDQGIPYDIVAWMGDPNETQFEAVMRARLLEMDEVSSISFFEVRLTNGVLGYTATLVTALGDITTNG